MNGKEYHPVRWQAMVAPPHYSVGAEYDEEGARIFEPRKGDTDLIQENEANEAKRAYQSWLVSVAFAAHKPA
jgi:hypothetical protein